MNNQECDPHATFAGFFMLFIAIVFGYLVVFSGEPTMEEIEKDRQEIQRLRNERIDWEVKKLGTY